MHKFYILLFCLATICPAYANEKPSELRNSITSTAPIGFATLKKFGFQVYDAALWADVQAFTYKKPFALTLTYKLGFSRQQLVEKSIEEISRIHAPNEQAISQLTVQLNETFPNVAAGDRITAVYTPNQKVQIFHNGRVRPAISADYARLFMDIWLSPRTSEPAVRAKLLQTADNLQSKGE